MLAEGNGNKSVCVGNLIKTIRGEVPFVRTKGVSRRLIDSPITRESEARADVKWTIETYEPRVESLETTLHASDIEHGDFGIDVEIT